MIGPSDSFIWGSGGAQLTPSQIDAQRKVAQALMAQGTDYSPVQSWSQGAARVAQAIFGGMQARDANEAVKNNQAAETQLIASLMPGGAVSTASTPSPVATPMGRTSIPASTSGKIYINDEPSPLDPPSGADRQAMVQTILGEAADQGLIGEQAVASVIRNRAINGGYGGDTPQGVVQAPNQFEPWNTQAGRNRMAAAASNPAQAAQADAAIALAYGEGGNAPADPTNGATHFYGPKVQAALGRRPPSWDNGTGVDIGGHRFFGGAPQTTQVAQADDPAALPVNAQPTQGFAIPGQPAAPTVSPSLMRAMSSPYISDGTKKILGAVFTQQLEAQQKANDPLHQIQIQEGQAKLEALPLQRRGQELANQKLERELQGEGAQALTPQERLSFGIPEGQPAYKTRNGEIKFGPAGTKITNNMGNAEGAFEKKGAELTASRYNDLIEDGQNSRQMASDITTLVDLGKTIGTGKGAQFKASIGPYAEALGIKVDGLSDIQAYEAVINRVAPNMRVKGSGSQSDFELKNFLKALPSLGNTPEGNEIAASVLQGLTQNKILASEIASKALNKEITRSDAEKQLRELPDPMQQYREYQKTKSLPSAAKPEIAAPQPGLVRDGYRFKGGDPSRKENWEQVS